jgi:3-oxoacyl-[acyl-carrier protein] reductase
VDLGLNGKVAVVAASSKGLGRATAARLAAEGASVVVSSRDEAALAKTASEIREETGSRVGHCVADLTKAEDIEKLVSRAVELFGGVDVLVTNSGGPPAGTFDEFGDEDWRYAFDLNLMSMIRLIRAALPRMRERGGGRIVCVASSSIKQPLENLILSNTFRTAMAGLAKSLATELAPDGILINTLGPGRIGTDRVAQMDEARAGSSGVPVEEVRRRAEALIPLGRYGTPEEFATVAAFLASPANTYVTGQAFLVDGGLVKAL